VFSSAKGVMMNDEINSMLEGITLCSDPPEHTGMRRVLARPMRPEKLRELTSRVGEEAERIIAHLVAKGTFDAATELAHYLPLTIVSDLVGLGDAGRDRILDWAAATFDAQGPMNRRTTEAFPKLDEMIHFTMTEAVPADLRRGTPRRRPSTAPRSSRRNRHPRDAVRARADAPGQHRLGPGAHR